MPDELDQAIQDNIDGKISDEELDRIARRFEREHEDDDQDEGDEGKGGWKPFVGVGIKFDLSIGHEEGQESHKSFPGLAMPSAALPYCQSGE